MSNPMQLKKPVINFFKRCLKQQNAEAGGVTVIDQSSF